MNAPVVTDVFKFLAVRPPQLVTEKETARTIIRDKRATTPVGKRELTALAGQLTTTGDALAFWRQLDLSSIEPLAEGYRELTRSYERLGPGGPGENPPDARTLMQEAGLSNVRDGSDPNLIGAAWKALYIAHATGRDAGPRLETPMAALRVLHFAETLTDEPRPSSLAALEALRATVAIPTVFDDAFQRHAPPAPSGLSAPRIASDADVDVSGRITPLGFGDLKVVKQTLLAYVAGEVAHIENVLKGESKERTHRKLDRTETTIFTSEETTKDTERDTQSTDRFELKREAETTLKEDMSIKAGLNVTASYGPVVATATGDFAYSTSKQDSAKSSSNFGHEVVDRSVTKVQTKTKTERTTKTLNEVEEINRHSLNNGPPSAAHVTGIYRWVDKRYRAQIYNYGRRFLLEFVIPEPAAYYRATHKPAAPKVHGEPPLPFMNYHGGVAHPTPLTANDINESSYLTYVARYGAAGVVQPPPPITYIGIMIVQDKLEAGKGIGMSSKEFVVPAGYKLSSYSATVTTVLVAGPEGAGAPKFRLQIGSQSFQPFNDVRSPDEAGVIEHNTFVVPGGSALTIDAEASGVVPISVGAYDVKAFAVNVQGICQRTNEGLAKWQLESFGKIQTAYQALQTVYDQKITQAESAAGITIEGQNPAINRIVENTELKKLCITMMTGQHFKQFGAMTEPPDDPAHPPEVDVGIALDDGPIIQFFEQAFEWEQITYIYYPYFWGRKKNWPQVAIPPDPDPLFQHFLTAGAARVLVPVPLAYAKSVIYLLQNGKKDLRDRVWGGGESPTLDSPLYISIAEELRNQTDDLAGAKPDPDVDPWPFTLPTTLVWLQPDDKLPVFA